jgi:hypothetical protein
MRLASQICALVELAYTPLKSTGRHLDEGDTQTSDCAR